MTPQELISFRNEQNRSETELEFLAFILHGLRQAQHEGNELLSQDIAQDAKRMEEAKDGMMKAEEQGEIQSSLLSSILDEIHKKDIDLSGVIAGLESVRAEIEASCQEERDTEPMEIERHERVISVLSELLNATRENKPEPTDLSPVVTAQNETATETHELLSSLITEIGKIDVRPEVKIDIPDKVEIKEPKWYKPFSFDTKWLKPIEYAVNAINPKPALARLEALLEKLYKKPFPTLPKTKDGSRILVEVDRTGGGSSGVINANGTPINPATEAKQDTIIAQLPTKTAQGDMPVATVPVLIEGYESLTGLSYSADVTNAALSTQHTGQGATSLSFDKSGTTQAYALIEKTITAKDISKYSAHRQIEFSVYLSSLTDISVVYVALGSSAANNFYWQTTVAELKAGLSHPHKELDYPTGQVGAGADLSNITWIGTYIGFNSAANTLTGIRIDNIELHDGNSHLLEEVASGSKPLSGAGVNGTRALTAANTWYSVPSTVPTEPYILTATIENGAGTIRWGYSNAGTPSATNGNKTTTDVERRLEAGQVLYFASSTAGDDINWTTKEI